MKEAGRTISLDKVINISTICGVLDKITAKHTFGNLLTRIAIEYIKTTLQFR